MNNFTTPNQPKIDDRKSGCIVLNTTLFAIVDFRRFRAGQIVHFILRQSLRPLISFFFLVVASTGCKHSSSSEQVRQSENGKLKPSVVVVPVIDSSHQPCNWNLSEELTCGIKTRLLQKGKFYLTEDTKARNLWHQLGPIHNPFGQEISWIKDLCPREDFAVFLELIEHEEISLNANPENSSSQFNVSLRIRVIDLRTYPCRVVLQEILHKQHHIPKPFTKFYFHQEPWGKQGFAISPIGLAHTQLIKEASSRIEKYILGSLF